MSQIPWRLVLPLAALAATSTGTLAASQAPRWKIAERCDIAQAPSWFPVDFSLLTHNKRQYAAFYDAGHHLTVATRALGERTWQTEKLGSKIGWDSHNYVTMAVDSAGDLHLAGNMHCVPLIYFRTATPGDITTFERLPMTGEREDRCTYPKFFRDANGRLLFQYRDGGSGNGSQIYNRYDAASKTWSRLLPTPLFDGEGRRNAYVHGPVAGPDHFFHVVWVWRETPDCATNHDLSYARSRDLIHWETPAGEALALPLKLQTPGLIVDPVPVGGGMINGGQKLVFDAKSRPLITYHKSDAAGNMQIFAARFEDHRWHRQVLTSWQRPVSFSGNGSMPFIGISLAAPQPVGDHGWTLRYQHRDYGSGLLGFRDDTLQPVELPPAPQRPEYPAELHRCEIAFKQVGVRQAGDLGHADDPGIRYVMAWETLPSNHDRPRPGPLPPPTTLRVFKLVRSE